MTQREDSKSKSQGEKPLSTKYSGIEPKTPDEIMSAGAKAASLLRSDEFNLAYKTLYDHYSTEFVGSQPHETNKREYAYVKIQVLSDVALELAALVNNALAAEAEVEMKKLDEESSDIEEQDAES